MLTRTTSMQGVTDSFNIASILHRGIRLLLRRVIRVPKNKQAIASKRTREADEMAILPGAGISRHNTPGYPIQERNTGNRQEQTCGNMGRTAAIAFLYPARAIGSGSIKPDSPRIRKTCSGNERLAGPHTVQDTRSKEEERKRATEENA